MLSLRGLVILRRLVASLVASTTALALVAVVPAAAAEFSADQKAEIQSIIKKYLVEHPDVLSDAFVELRNRAEAADAAERKTAFAKVRDQLVSAPNGIEVGNPAGKITVVEFFDYNCGYCRQALGKLGPQVRDNKNVRLILRDFPILSPQSMDASLVADAVHNQFSGEKFWSFHTKLLESHGAVGKERAMAVAKELGADMAKLEKDVADPKTRAAVDKSMALARDLSIDGTPSFVVGDDVIAGAKVDELSDRIKNLEKCGKAMCS